MNSNVQIGPGFLGLCALASIVLAVLKLTGVLAVSWLVVALPFLAGIALTVVLVIIGVLLVIVAGGIATR